MPIWTLILMATLPTIAYIKLGKIAGQVDCTPQMANEANTGTDEQMKGKWKSDHR